MTDRPSNWIRCPDCRASWGREHGTRCRTCGWQEGAPERGQDKPPTPCGWHQLAPQLDWPAPNEPCPHDARYPTHRGIEICLGHTTAYLIADGGLPEANERVYRDAQQLPEDYDVRKTRRAERLQALRSAAEGRSTAPSHGRERGDGGAQPAAAYYRRPFARGRR